MMTLDEVKSKLAEPVFDRAILHPEELKFKLDNKR